MLARIENKAQLLETETEKFLSETFMLRICGQWGSTSSLRMTLILADLIMQLNSWKSNYTGKSILT